MHLLPSADQGAIDQARPQMTRGSVGDVATASVELLLAPDSLCD